LFVSLVLLAAAVKKENALEDVALVADKQQNLTNLNSLDIYECGTNRNDLKVRLHRRCGPAILPSDAISIENFLSPRH
jgi:hypothetical protein